MSTNYAGEYARSIAPRVFATTPEKWQQEDALEFRLVRVGQGVPVIEVLITTGGPRAVLKVDRRGLSLAVKWGTQEETLSHPLTPEWQAFLAFSHFRRTCQECDRVFDLRSPEDSQEWAYGHDCEA